MVPCAAMLKFCYDCIKFYTAQYPEGKMENGICDRCEDPCIIIDFVPPLNWQKPKPA